MFVCDHEPTEQEMEAMYEDYMKQYGDTVQEQEYNYNQELVRR